MIREDYINLMKEIEDVKKALGLAKGNPPVQSQGGNNIFEELKTKKFEGKREP